ncbi:MAG: hypothetical protein WCR72_12330 [Bacteroidota bacterium]
MANPTIRITIPKRPADLISLAKKINKKHLADGTASPLLLLQTNSWSEAGPVTDQCFAAHEEAESLTRQAEELYRKRDALLDQIDAAVKASRDLLLGIYHEEPKTLGQWGYEVNDTPHLPEKTAN